MGITVVSTALNAEAYAARCTESVARQSVRAQHIYVDACSDDRTAEEAQRGNTLAMVLRDERRQPILANLGRIIRKLPADEIVCWMDGDDWLAVDGAIERVAKEYEQGAWATFGNFVWPDGTLGFAEPYPHNITELNAFRLYGWRATHLKTFRAGLFRQIPDAYLQEADGAWYELAVDQAVMLAVLELAGHHTRCIPSVLYAYNHSHAFESNTNEDGLQRERDTCARIRSRTPLTPLSAAPW